MQKACEYDVRKALIRDLLISIHKTRGFEWQTAHTKGCLENRCVNTVPSQRKSNVSSFHFLGCQVGKELVGCEEDVEEEVVLSNIRTLLKDFNHVIDDPRAERLVAGCCLLAFVDLQVVRIAVRTAKAPELVPEADGLFTNEHLRTVAPKVRHHIFIDQQIFVEHSKFDKGGVNTGVNWSNIRNSVALFQVVAVRKVNVALDVAKTCPTHCL